MVASDIMIKEYESVRQNTPLSVIWELIFKKNINAVLVTDGKKKLLGIISREDILRTLYPKYSEYLEDLKITEKKHPLSKELQVVMDMKAKDIMEKNVIYARMNTPLMRMLARMIARRVEQLPIVTDAIYVKGIVSKKDIFRVLFTSHKKIFSAKN